MKRLLLGCILALFSTPTFAEDAVYHLTLKDHKFSPDTLEVPAGTRFKITVDNQDPTPEEMESNSMKFEKIITPNRKGTVNAGPLKPGTYEFFGEFNEKTAQGKVIVK